MRMLALVAALAMALPAGAAEIVSSVDAGALPDGKKSPLGLYLTPADAHSALQADPGIVFLDVRDPIEIAFVGYAEGTDAIVPLAVATHRFDPRRGSYAMEPNKAFIAEVERAVARDGKGKTDPVFVVCRSGSRSAAAAAMLAKQGFTNVWSLVEGFEGDSNKATGARDVNGWKNAGLPWTMKLDERIAWQPSE